jgi:hypothetical protein
MVVADAVTIWVGIGASTCREVVDAAVDTEDFLSLCELVYSRWLVIATGD